MDLSFYSLSSGSSGNCYYLGNGFHGILIDAGIPAGSIRKFLNGLAIPVETIMGVLITHNHIDHIRGLEVLLKKNAMPAFTSRNVWKSILKSQNKISPICIKEISLRQKFHLAGFDVEAFPVNHDSPETLGFHIYAGEKKITIATDLGHICETAAHYLEAADILVIESNYDEAMLMNGSYPWFLKSRIKSDHGHLGNHQTSSFLAGIINDTPKKICLAHLSKNNNTPETALNTLYNTFSERGIREDISTDIIVLKRNSPTVILGRDDRQRASDIIAV